MIEVYKGSHEKLGVLILLNLTRLFAFIMSFTHLSMSKNLISPGR